MDWLKILSAIFLILMLVFLLPRAKDMLKNSPKAEKGDWNSALIPIVGVVGFIIVLIWLVQN
jgi:hypothetical protein